MSIIVGNHIFFTDPSHSRRTVGQSEVYARHMNGKLFGIQLERFGAPNEHISLDSPYLPEDLRKILDHCLLAFSMLGDHWFAEITNASECQMTGPSEPPLNSTWQWLALHIAPLKKDCYVSRMNPYSQLKGIFCADMGGDQEVI